MNNSWPVNASLGLITTLIGGLDQRWLIAPREETPSIVDSKSVESLIVGLFQVSQDIAMRNSIPVPRYQRTQTAGPIKFIRERLTTNLNRGGTGRLIGSLLVLTAACLGMVESRLTNVQELLTRRGSSDFFPVPWLNARSKKETKAAFKFF